MDMSLQCGEGDPNSLPPSLKEWTSIIESSQEWNNSLTWPSGDVHSFANLKSNKTLYSPSITTLIISPRNDWDNNNRLIKLINLYPERPIDIL